VTPTSVGGAFCQTDILSHRRTPAAGAIYKLYIDECERRQTVDGTRHLYLCVGWMYNSSTHWSWLHSISGRLQRRFTPTQIYIWQLLMSLYTINATFLVFLPRNAMHKRGLCCRAVAGCLTVCLSHLCTVETAEGTATVKWVDAWNRKPYPSFQMVQFSMTLSDL